MDFQIRKNEFEESIRRGDTVSVLHALESMPVSSIPREFAVDFANIARRVRADVWGLRLLRPIVRSEIVLRPAVTVDEQCAYAGLLIKVGALDEARDILETIEVEKNASVLTFRAQIATARWDYDEAAKVLKKLVVRKDVDIYQKTVAQVNLASALIATQDFELAEIKLAEIRKECKAQGWDLLDGNALELSAQMAVIRYQWDKAVQFLSEAESKSGKHSRYQLFIEKWRTLAELFQTNVGSPASGVALAKIEALRTAAARANSWETVRDLDYHVAYFLEHQNLFLNVYFGTPFPSYKRRIESLFKKRGWKIPKHYYRKMTSAPAARVLDLETATEEGNEFSQTEFSQIKPGQMLHRLLNVLATDFYKPMGLGELFTKVYPGEFYNPDSAAERVAQAVKLLRKWFTTNSIPLEIAVDDGRYLLTATAAYALKLARTPMTVTDFSSANAETQLKTLKTQWPHRSFSAAQAARHLGISPSSVRTILQMALSEQRLFQSGAGRSTLYRFKK